MGIWKLVARAQRVGLSEGMRGKGGAWLAMGVGAWGLQRLRSMAGKEDEILVREALGPGQSMTITRLEVTQAQAQKIRKQAKKDAKALDKRAKKAEHRAQEQGGGRSRARTRARRARAAADAASAAAESA